MPQKLYQNLWGWEQEIGIFKRLSSVHFSSVQSLSHSVVSDSSRTHGPQHTRPPCPSPALGVYSNLSPLTQ